MNETVVRRGKILGLYGIWGDGDATLRLDDGTDNVVRLDCNGPQVIAALERFFGKVLGEPGEVPILSPVDNKTGAHVGREIFLVIDQSDGSLRGFMPVSYRQLFVRAKSRPGDPEDEEISDALQKTFDEAKEQDKK